MNQYLNSDNDSDDDMIPSETPNLAASVGSGGSDDDPDDGAGSVGFEMPPNLDEDEDEDEDDSADDQADDVMSIFEEEEEVDEDMTALSQWLVEIDAAELLAEARSVARKLAAMLSD